jgi:hypothetical protein
MHRAPVLVTLVALVACAEPVAPNQEIQGSWVLAGAPHRALEPGTLTLYQIGRVIFGQATLVGLDPVSPGVPTVSVAGDYSPPTASLAIRIDTTLIANLLATVDQPDHMGAVLTFTDAVGGGTDTISYIRP